jgi:hypothetical protein
MHFVPNSIALAFPGLAEWMILLCLAVLILGGIDRRDGNR